MINCWINVAYAVCSMNVEIASFLSETNNYLLVFRANVRIVGEVGLMAR